MSRLPWGRILFILVIVAVSALILLFKEIKLGMDLKGGAQILVRVHADEAIEKELDDVFSAAHNALLEAELPGGEHGIEIASTVRSINFREGIDYRLIDDPESDPPFVEFTLASLGDVQAAENAIRRRVNVRGDGLWDLSINGPRIRLTMKSSAIFELRASTVEKVRNSMRTRIDTLGMIDPNIVISGDPRRSMRILLLLPGVEDPEEAKRRIQTPGNLEYRMVVYNDAGMPYRAATREALLDMIQGAVPPGAEPVPQYEQTMAEVQGAERTPVYWYLLYREAPVNSNYLIDAEVDRDQRNRIVVRFTFNAEGGERMRQLTRPNVDKLMAIVLDDEAIEVANISEEIGSEGHIVGRFTQTSAQRLAFLLRTGAVPTSMHFEEERSVGPALGLDSIRLGFQAMIIGMALVALFMLFYYRLSGLVANIALALNILLIMAFLAWFGAVLTLPGIAGIILTIGMSVDANVLIFERIREEIRLGRTIRSSIDGGFGKAFSTIFDANVTTLIAAIFLFQAEQMRGFATTITIGILASMFTAIFVARVFFDSAVAVRRNKMRKLSI